MREILWDSPPDEGPQPVARDTGYEYGTILPYRRPIGGGDAQWGLRYSELAKSIIDAITAPRRSWQGTSSPDDAMNLAMNLLGANVAVGAPMGAGTLAMAGGKKKAALRTLNFRDLPKDEALRLAREGAHLKMQSEGAYYGGPRDITSSAKLGGNRLRMDRELDAAAREIETAMGPEGVGDWYPSQKRGVASVTEYPAQARRMAQAEGLFSPQATPEGELGFSITAHNRFVREEPVGTVRTGKQGANYERALRTGTEIPLGKKTSIYAGHSDPNAPIRHTGTNDFRQAQYMGYTDPKGAPQTAGMGEAQHAFMDAETMLLADRANRKGLAGRQDWTAPMVQEVPWVAEKANALQKQRPEAFPNTPAGRAKAIEEASMTVEDYIPKHTAGATYEYVPGASTGHVPRLPVGPEEYGARGAWMRPNDEMDLIYSGMRMLQKPSGRGTGAYRNSLGKIEQNPVNIAQPLAEFAPSRATGTQIDPKTADMLGFGETFRGAMDAQEAAAWHLPVTQSTRKAGTQSHALLRLPRAADAEQVVKIRQVLPEGWDLTASPQGVMLMNFSETKGATLAKQMRKLKQELEPMTGGTLRRVGMDSELIPVFTREIGGKTVPTPAGEGAVTSQVLERATRSPGSARNLSESDAVRAAIREKIARDTELGGQGLPVREDIQRMRRFFSEADWAKAVELMKKGMAPAAAVAALGYSLSGMASGPSDRR